MSLAIVFSPQGSQSVGMGRELATTWPSAAAVFAEADAALGWPVSTLCWDGPAERLNDTRQTQPCLVATSLACLRALEEASAGVGRALSPAFMAGHSVGEYAALAAAGVLSLADALRLVALRGALMADAGADGGMAAVIGLDREAVAQAVERAASEAGTGHDPVLANDNAPGQVVISGSRPALAAAQPHLSAAGARRIIPLNVSGPFHSPFMADAGRRLAEAFGDVAWSEADPPLVANVNAQPVREPNEIRELLARQVSAPVEWVRSVQRLVADGVDTIVECGPGQALTGMVKRIAPELRALNVMDSTSLAATLRELTSTTAEASV
ncbi:MAG TPA: ACP S-malonyltransferase [Candidatus Limnocylindria bacterium]|nr:ACP S-malonyltransferase [Candidatus Limnocylindria bacterium]